ncbi:IQ domain-containing protein C [Boleophthalmus pectinirostris]|uniref:IQ domain-containing protein C n=1 Tax=Boleophthalmus pectinirostris TaxID=150288 RepID=UPI00242E31AB|nr:IQ domain-containing protein C [Boleophthalmus pectinirostris]
MDRGNLERTITHFQARARGYLLRAEVHRAREDYEEIVKEIDGDLHCLKWIKRALYFPYFTDTPSAISPYNFENIKSETINQRKCSSPVECSSNRDVEDGAGHSEKMEAERDISQIITSAPEPRDGFSTSAQNANTQTGGEHPVRKKDEGGMESACDSTTVWSSVDTDSGSSRSVKPGLRQYCLARDVPRTPEALRIHRNTLSMELLWLQQAIDSRKKYLSLKNKLSVS